MERAVYCYGWLPDRPNCHPVHTMRSLGMVEDLENRHASILVWSMMGSGSLSLPFLERQIDGEIPPQLRFHGFLTDKEFNEECLKRGILPFAVVYQAQGWEFPVKLSPDGKRVLEMNMMRTPGESETYGLREFNRNVHWELFGKKFEDYFPDGLVNSDGQPVTDLYEECTTRNLYGEPTHSTWVEVDKLSHTCYGMCRNNPVWRQYLKKIVEIQIDAGAMAVQLDESETPITSLMYGGCFCKDCMKQFNDYLTRLKAEGKLPAELMETDLERFDYPKYLRERNVDWPKNFYDIPFSKLYWDFVVESSNRHFAEIIDYVKEYGRSKGKDIRVSGNFTNMHLLYYPVLEKVDVCITEFRHTLLKRHNWFRLAAGYTKDKTVVLAEGPYDDFMPRFVELIKQGKGDDFYQIFAMEAAVHGCNMAFPYGAWMGNKIKDSFSAPAETGRRVQDFLYAHDDLFGKKSGANVLVLYSYGSNMERDWHSGQGEYVKYTDADNLLSYRLEYEDGAVRMPYFELSQVFCDKNVNFDVLVTGDGGLVPDEFKAENLGGYEAVVLPDCFDMTESQTKILWNYASRGGKVFVYGGYAENIPGAAKRLAALPSVTVVSDISDAEKSREDFCRRFFAAYEPIRQIRRDNTQVFVQRTDKEGETVFHLINYAYDRASGRIAPQDVCLDLRADAPKAVRAVTFEDQPLSYERMQGAEGLFRVKINHLPVYGALILEY